MLLTQHTLPGSGQVGGQRVSLIPQQAPRHTLSKRWSRALNRGTAVRALQGGSGDPGQENEGKIKSPALSLFTPYKNLPKPGQIADEEDLMCNPELYNCRTPVYVYEEKCPSCYGTGYVRQRSASRGGRGSLGKCLACTGMGYVRRTTTRFEPSVPTNSDDTRFSVARTLPPGEVEQVQKFDPREPPPQ